MGKIMPMKECVEYLFARMYYSLFNNQSFAQILQRKDEAKKR